MTDTTARLSLPWLMPAQAQKHVTVNEALRRLDGLVQAAVQSRSETTEPSSPDEGQGWILPEGATGIHWDGFAGGDLVIWQDGAWTRHVPGPGWRVWVIDAAELAVFDGEDWQGFSSGGGNVFAELGVGTSPDEANPFAAKLNAALWTAREDSEGGSGDLRYTLNKEGPENVLSLLFQSGWQGRAEMGLVGDDDVQLKVSDDGENWKEALRVDRETGEADFPSGIRLGGLALLRSETRALLDAFIVPVPSFAHALAYDQLIGTLHAAGLWDKLNGLWVLWAHDEQAGRVNIKVPESVATRVSAMAFVPGVGFQGNGSSSYLDTGFNPATMGDGIYTQNSAHISTFITSDNGGSGVGNGLVGQIGGNSSNTGSFWLLPRRLSSTIRHGLNRGGEFLDTTTPQDSSAGFTLVSRTAADALGIYKGGALLDTGSYASDGVCSASFGIASAIGAHSNATHGAASIGAGLDEDEVARLFHALDAHRRAIAIV